MSQVKAKLTVVLMADSVVGAEAEDARLWQQVLNVINGDAAVIGSAQKPMGAQFKQPDKASEKSPPQDTDEFVANGETTVDKFADFLKLDTASVQGACSPTATEPYLHLDSHYWEAFKTQVTNLSGKSISPISMAATLLLCWARYGGIASVTQATAKKVLGTINLQDTNSTRGLKKTSWLSLRGGGTIILNPAEISKAQLATRCFCKKDWSEWNA